MIYSNRLSLFLKTLPFLLIPMLAGADSIQTGADFQFTADETSSQSFTGTVSRIEVETFNGSIDVVASKTRSVQADVTKRGSGNSNQEARDDIKNIEVKMTRQGSVLKIVARRSVPRTNSGALVKLLVPGGTALKLMTSNEAITASGPVGEMTAETSNGAIRVKGATGRLHLTTDNAPIKVEGGSGVMTLETANEGIDIRAERAVVSAQTSNGTIHFAGSLAKGRHSFTTTSEDITLALPAGTRFNVDAEADNGAVTSDFPVSASEQSDGVLKGIVGNGGGLFLELQANNGNIRIGAIKR